MADLIASRAHIADEVALEAADLESPRLTGKIITMPHATVKERAISAEVTPSRVKS
jgi:hypothetical protein